MSNRKSYFENFPSSSLFVLLKQRIEELEELNGKESNEGIRKRKQELNLLIDSIKSTLINRFINSDCSIRDISLKMLNSEDEAKEIYKNIFMLRVINRDELIDIGLLEKVINELDVESILMLINNKKGTIYETLATERYNNMIFEVGEDVYNDYLLKESIDSTLVEEEKHETKVESPFNIDDTITISRYVNNYLGISADCSNLLHCGLKDLKSNYVMGVDNNYANMNPELVFKGYLLLVMDANNKRGTYINPYYIERLLEEEKVERELKTFYKHVAIDLDKIKEYMENFEVLARQAEVNEELNQLIRDTHKVKKMNLLKKERERKGC